MMLAAYNLIGLVSNNGNQNNDNNINRNNDNNNNNQNVNEATTDTMNMNMGMVILPPLPPGRMLNLTRGTMLENKILDTTRTRHKRGLHFPACYTFPENPLCKSPTNSDHNTFFRKSISQYR